MAGKTGTAQHNELHADHVLFVGYAPAEQPQLSIAVRITYGYNSGYASEIGRDIAKVYFNPETAGELITGSAATSRRRNCRRLKDGGMTMNKLVTIRSNRYGLDIEFDSETEFDQLLEVLGQKFKQSGRFFKDAQMALSFSGRELTRAEEDRVLAVIRENTQIEILCIIEPNDKNEMMYRSVVEQSLSDIYKKEGIFYKGTLRKRQILEAEESIVILGDVELGAKVIAKGSVIIIGTLYGSVCAGASGDTSAYVVALSMQPKYLSIGDIVAKRQIIYQESLNIKGPKIAVIDGNRIYLDPLTD